MLLKQPIAFDEKICVRHHQHHDYQFLKYFNDTTTSPFVFFIFQTNGIKFDSILTNQSHMQILKIISYNTIQMEITFPWTLQKKKNIYSIFVLFLSFRTFVQFSLYKKNTTKSEWKKKTVAKMPIYIFRRKENVDCQIQNDKLHT